MRNYFSKKSVGLVCLLIALGMLLMMISNRLAGLAVIALLLFVSYSCLCGD
ncbi:MAG: hypothetical protein IJ747_03925 [Lachnospiraceae bacterium]|nr:hypothetical protein [Lachnospiraceae bacterium]